MVVEKWCDWDHMIFFYEGHGEKLIQTTFQNNIWILFMIQSSYLQKTLTDSSVLLQLSNHLLHSLEQEVNSS